MAALRLLLVRHGQTASNAEGRLQGHLPTPLNTLGLAQARSLAGRLAGFEPPVERLIASDLVRAVETATPIAAALGLEPELDPAWRERAFGSFEGRAVGDTEIWRAASGTLDPPGAEPLDELRRRVRRALLALADRHRDARCVAVVTHGGVMRTALGLLADNALPLASGGPRPDVVPVLNGSLLHLEVEAGEWRVLRINDVDHLVDAARTATDAG